MIALTFLGILVVAWTIAEIGTTTLTAQGAGPLTSRGLRLIWKLCLRVFSKSPRRHAIFTKIGPLFLALTALGWYVGLWLGWWLVFLGASGSIVDSSTNEPASALDTLYFAGYTITTLGIGDFKPSGGIWQILTAVCAANGLLALTLSVTYLVPILSAAVQKRQLALTIHGIGSTPTGILERAWCGKSLSSLDGILPDISTQILTLGEQHLAYPILHYFHSRHAESALPVRLAAFSEAIDVIAAATPQEVRPSRLSLIQCQAAVATFLRAMESAHIDTSERQPAPPDMSEAVASGVPVDAAPNVGAGAGGADRRLLKSLVESDGWSWHDVVSTGGDRSPS
ncbi:MAG: hypothetical protein CMP81_21195 [Fulvimarina sp.]|nr:hypothetical protein [Fulvimarina sp.]